MKEYCLVPVSIAEKCMYNTTTTSPTAVSKRPTPTVVSKRPTPTVVSRPPTPPIVSSASVRPSLPSRINPPLDDLIRVAVAPAYREYGLSLVRLLDKKPNVAWDEKGNFLPPFAGLNMVNLINNLGNPRGKFSSEEQSLLSMLFRLTQLSPDAIRNTKQKKKQLVGGTWLAY